MPLKLRHVGVGCWPRGRGSRMRDQEGNRLLAFFFTSLEFFPSFGAQIVLWRSQLSITNRNLMKIEIKLQEIIIFVEV